MKGQIIGFGLNGKACKHLQKLFFDGQCVWLTLDKKLPQLLWLLLGVAADGRFLTTRVGVASPYAVKQRHAVLDLHDCLFVVANEGVEAGQQHTGHEGGAMCAFAVRVHEGQGTTSTGIVVEGDLPVAGYSFRNIRRGGGITGRTGGRCSCGLECLVQCAESNDSVTDGGGGLTLDEHGTRPELVVEESGQLAGCLQAKQLKVHAFSLAVGQNQRGRIEHGGHKRHRRGEGRVQGCIVALLEFLYATRRRLDLLGSRGCWS